MAPRNHVEVYFRALVPDSYQHVAVGPFGAGAFLRPGGTGLELVTAQWGMITPGSRTRRPTSRAILTNNARAETVASRPTY
jgi:putative SOS response-associated peptidase YedK